MHEYTSAHTLHASVDSGMKALPTGWPYEYDLTLISYRFDFFFFLFFFWEIFQTCLLSQIQPVELVDIFTDNNTKKTKPTKCLNLTPKPFPTSMRLPVRRSCSGSSPRTPSPRSRCVSSFFIIISSDSIAKHRGCLQHSYCNYN